MPTVSTSTVSNHLLMPFLATSSEYRALDALHRIAETTLMAQLLPMATSSIEQQQRATERAAVWVKQLRAERQHAGGVDALMQEFALDSDEGVALMCLAEALLRIPDAATQDALIRDKLAGRQWQKHVGASPSWLVNVAAWGLVVTGKVLRPKPESTWLNTIQRVIQRSGEPVIRRALDVAMKLLGEQFVLGQTIGDALKKGQSLVTQGYTYSFDMLGEAALTHDDAARYLAAYQDAIDAIGTQTQGRGVRAEHGISIKLSALHPRYQRSQWSSELLNVRDTLYTTVLGLCQQAAQYNIGLNIDAEESERLLLSLDLMQRLLQEPSLAQWSGLGFVVQAYSKRATAVITQLITWAKTAQRQIMIRLVKGAYWDSEIKRTQVEGLADYPVLTRKVHTDVSYLACAKQLLAATEVIYPQFATHNALSVATIQTWIDDANAEREAQGQSAIAYEFQCLHGMGEGLYGIVNDAKGQRLPCRIYAPVGSHQTLLAYLVRRLLENGANSSFVHQLVDETLPLEQLLADPVAAVAQTQGLPHPQIPLPRDLYAHWQNSAGWDWSNEAQLMADQQALQPWSEAQWHAESIHLPDLAQDAALSAVSRIMVTNPAQRQQAVGTAQWANVAQIQSLPVEITHNSMLSVWHDAHYRANVLRQAADLIEAQRVELLALLVREAGKTWHNAIAEVREAVDFLRFYALQISALQVSLSEVSSAHSAGVVVCISPWNFPLAIFMGQIAAALAAGHAVWAKPAEQTPLIAYRATQLLVQAGVPKAYLRLILGQGETVGAALVAHPAVDAVMFTGSTQVAKLIQRQMIGRVNRWGQPLSLIAETGGQNALWVDSSALPEQVVQDVVQSAFDSAGQRCSALRILCVQRDVADHTLMMLRGAVQLQTMGNPWLWSHDIGPVIDEAAQANLLAAIHRLRQAGCAIWQPMLSVQQQAQIAQGSFVLPTLIEIEALSQLQQEVFGPVLHVLRYDRDDLPILIEQLNDLGYGLTGGVHSRIDDTIALIEQRTHVGNIYVNRNMVGAVVGVQPFGGEGLSGTGPKAGGGLIVPRLQMLSVAHKGLAQTANSVDPASSQVVCAMQNWAVRHPDADETQPWVWQLPSATGEDNRYEWQPRAPLSRDASWVVVEPHAIQHSVNHQSLSLAQVEQSLQATQSKYVTMKVEQALDYIATVPRAELAGVIVLDQSQDDRGAWAPLQQALAQHHGDIKPFITATALLQPQGWTYLLVEKSCSTNTTAAGGNATLMGQLQ
jgi:RHH-type proline utilization regulon transcriptional repressor/proline dehydrogenase/delta 1-pyrroline-5-carboxylate dehydrogenase